MTIGKAIAVVGVAAVGCITGVIMASEEVVFAGLGIAAVVAFWA